MKNQTIKNLNHYSLRREDLAAADDLMKIDSLVHKRGAEVLDGSTTGVTVYPLQNQLISLRTGTTDAVVFYETFSGLYHLPPYFPDRVETILDLGANIGLTAAHYCVMFPQAQLIGVEADSKCSLLAIENTQPWKERCRIINAAVWKDNGTVMFGVKAGHEYAGSVGGQGEQVAVNSITINALIDQLGVKCVDFVKMDIEGAETSLIKEANDWAPRVNSLLVELHGYSTKECISQLRQLGFHAWRHKGHWASVFAIKPEYRTDLKKYFWPFWK